MTDSSTDSGPIGGGAFAPGTVSIRLYGHEGSAEVVIATLREQAERCAAAGFDGITVSEHHGSFAGYLPNPLQLTSWLLEWCSGAWAAPCPLLLPLRPAGLVAEEVAWLRACHPGRVGLAVAAGALGQDFEIAGVAQPDESLATRFEAGLAIVARALSGRAAGPLAGDVAVAATAARPVPVLSAAMSTTAARRAARHGTGIALDSLSSRDHLRSVVDTYLAAGGTGPRLLTRWVWVGEPRTERIRAQLDAYRRYTPPDRIARWPAEPDVICGAPGAMADDLLRAMEQTGSTCLNLRVHIAGVAPAEAMEQIELVGRHVLPLLRDRLTGSGGPLRLARQPSKR